MWDKNCEKKTRQGSQMTHAFMSASLLSLYPSLPLSLSPSSPLPLSPEIELFGIADSGYFRNLSFFLPSFSLSPSLPPSLSLSLPLSPGRLSFSG